jgi:ABC-2 type transport system permease protein
VNVDQLLSELRKMRSTRTNLGLLAGMVVLILLFVLLNGLLAKGFSLEQSDNQHNLLGLGTIAALFAALVGVMAITSEFRHGTIRPTFLFTPRRNRVIAAKVVASLLMGMAFGLLATAISFGVGYAILAGRGITLALGGGEIVLLVLGSIAMTALWAALGVGLGAILRNQVFTIVGLIAWVFVVENLLQGLVPGVGRFTPTAAAASITGDPAAHLLDPLPGGLLLLAYAAVFVAIGGVLVAKRDVT